MWKATHANTSLYQLSHRGAPCRIKADASGWALDIGANGSGRSPSPASNPFSFQVRTDCSETEQVSSTAPEKHSGPSMRQIFVLLGLESDRRYAHLCKGFKIIQSSDAHCDLPLAAWMLRHELFICGPIAGPRKGCAYFRHGVLAATGEFAKLLLLLSPPARVQPLELSNTLRLIWGAGCALCSSSGGQLVTRLGGRPLFSAFSFLLDGSCGGVHNEKAGRKVQLIG